ncbi:MAG: hypothetical protein IKP54_08995 [Bacteroidales bacterium]|nr:hypothetical protein [Bacteroidales bacterium]
MAIWPSLLYHPDSLSDLYEQAVVAYFDHSIADSISYQYSHILIAQDYTNGGTNCNWRNRGGSMSGRCILSNLL